MKQLLLFMLILTVVACKPNDDDDVVQPIDTSINPLPEKMKALLFDSSSYWIYQNESTLAFDTVEIISVKEKVYWSPPGGPGIGSCCPQQYFIVIYHSNLIPFYRDIHFSGMINRNGLFSDLIYYGYLIEDSAAIFNVSLDSIYNSYRVNNRDYQNVEKIEILSKIGKSTHSYYYYADSIGVIRKELLIDNQTQVWNLQEFDAQLFFR